MAAELDDSLWRPLKQRLKARVTDWHPLGLISAIGVGVTIMLIAGFVSVAKDVLFLEDLARIDAMVLGFIQDYRTTSATVFFRVITNLAGIEAVAVGLLALLVAAWRTRLLPVLFGMAVLVGVVITQTLKVLFGRLRPEEALWLVAENGFSFPSGHTFLATILFGLGGYVLARSAASRAGRWTAAASAFVLICLIGFSRMYLGVHYPSDVLASFLLASALLTLTVTLVEINHHLSLRPRLKLPAAATKPLITTFIVMLVVSVTQVVIA